MAPVAMETQKGGIISKCLKLYETLQEMFSRVCRGDFESWNHSICLTFKDIYNLIVMTKSLVFSVDAGDSWRLILSF